MQEKEEPAFTGARTILFMIGGMTYSEMRTAYDVSKQHNREVIVGASFAQKPFWIVVGVIKLNPL